MLGHRSFAALFLLSTLSAAACSSSGTTTTTTSPADYCSALSSYVSRCNLTNACITATVGQCSSLASVASSAALAANAECLNETPCGDAGQTLDLQGCYQAKLAAPTPTAAQTKLAQDYCAVCAAPGQSAAACASSFYPTDTDAGVAVGGVPGAGTLLQYSDAVATNIDAQCVPADAGALGCLGFGVCALKTLAAAAPPEPAACTGGVSFGDAGTPADGG